MSLRINVGYRLAHFKQPAGTSRGVYLTRNTWIVTVRDTVTGQTGVGECAPLPDLSCDAIPDYEQRLRDICRLVEMNDGIDTCLLRPYPSMLFGLETAMLNLQNGGDVIFDTPFTRGEEGIPINGLVWMGTAEEMTLRVEEKLKAGFRCVKLKIGAIDFEQEVAIIKGIRDRFPADVIQLRLDANGGFSPEDAMKKLDRLAKYDIHSIEQPIRQRQWRSMADICRNSPIPIALDEELIGVNIPEMKCQLLDEIHPAYIILKPSLHGGMCGCEEWVVLAQERGIGSWMTSALELNIGLNAIAQFAAHLYGPSLTMPQGLGTGQLFTDNIPMPLIIKGEKLYLLPLTTK